jgi:hypothetical protein
MKKLIVNLFILMLSVPVISQGYEGDCEEDENGELVCYEDEGDTINEEPCGLEIKWKDGAIKSMKACSAASWVGKYKRKKARTAMKKATLRAKGKIAKFLGETITSNEFLKNVEGSTDIDCGEDEETGEAKECSESETEKAAGERYEELETYTEEFSGNAKAYLKGVKRISQEVFKDEKEAIVLVGWSLKTAKAADQINKAMKTDSTKSKKSKKKSRKKKKKRKSLSTKSKDFDEF